MSALAPLVGALREAGVIAADAPSPPEAMADRPWFVALLQGFAGWLAGVFLLVFLGLIFKPDERVSIFVLGALLLVTAWVIYQLDRDAVFLDQFALALSIAGQFAVAWSSVHEDFTGFSLAGSVLLLQLLIWAVMPNQTARTLAALFATVAWVYTVRFLLAPPGTEAAYLGLSRGESPQRIDAWTAPVGWLITWLPLIAAAGWLIAREARWMASGWRAHARPALTGLLLGLSLAGVATEPITFLVLGADAWGIGFTWWSLFPLLSIGLAGLAAYGAFRVRSGGLLGFAILAALLHLSRFYYLYGTTLLWKAVLMASVGASMLGLALLFQRRGEAP